MERNSGAGSEKTNPIQDASYRPTPSHPSKKSPARVARKAFEGGFNGLSTRGRLLAPFAKQLKLNLGAINRLYIGQNRGKMHSHSGK